MRPIVENFKHFRKVLRTFVDEEPLRQPDIFSCFYSEVTRGLAERTGASAELEWDSMTVVIPQMSSSGTAIVNAPVPETEAGFFNPFGLMPRDIRDRM